MRHKVAGKKLGRIRDHRISLRKNLIKDLFRYGKLNTTEAKADAVRAEAEKMITMAKRALANQESRIGAMSFCEPRS